MRIASFWGNGTAVSEKCAVCGLHSKCATPFTKVHGDGNLRTLLVMEKPSEQEERGRSAFSGSTMAKVTDGFADFGIDIQHEFWKCNAIQCYTKKVTDAEPELCRNNLIKIIHKYKPKHIITVGYTATKTAIGHMCELPKRADSLPFHHIPVHEYGAWVHPIMNPANMKTRNEMAYMDRSYKSIMQDIKLNRKMVEVNPFEKVEVLTDYDDVLDAIEWLYTIDDPLFAWDTETTGLKPHWEEHFITSVGIAARDRVFSFPLYHDEAYGGDYSLSKDVENALVDVMQDSRFKKIAHNRKFDEQWLEVTADCIVNGGIQCTATNQHLLDHRANTKGLKWQAFCRWGVVEYDKRAKPYIEAEQRGAKGKNRMQKMPLREQLLYVGADAYLTLKLSDEQDGEYAESDNPLKHRPRLLFHESTDTLKRIEKRGIPSDSKYYKQMEIELLDKMAKEQKAIDIDPGVIEFNSRYSKNFKQTSPIDLKEVLFNIKGYDASTVNKTYKGNVSVDEKALKDIDDPLCASILNYRKLYKLYNTYMAQFLFEEVDGIIHPNFNLVIPRSYRGSCLNPNIQNVPKHDKYANKVCRTGLHPKKGMGMGEMDFTGMEVGTSAAYHKDPNFINYLVTPGTDMHRDNTCDLWCVSPQEVHKNLRYHTKNCWTFPQFYGDWYGSCAPELWKQVITKNNMALETGETIVERLHDNNIHNLDDFLKHCQDVEDKMWNERFKVYTAWKKEVNDFYLKYGYVETFMGFRFTGLLDTKQTSNYPIQGTAFHLLLWCLNKLDKWMVSEKLWTYICGQIHDSIVFCWQPEELEYVKEKMVQVCTVDLANEFEWINVPMGIDIEVSKLYEEGGNFSNIGD